MKTYKMQGYSMGPTIRPNQVVQVDELAYRRRRPERLDVILTWVSPAEARGHRWQTVKRVIGLPGDTVEIRSGKVFINGASLREPYVKHWAGYSLPELHVTRGHYFVLGDNRAASADSRVWGTVPRGNIVGRVLLAPPGTGQDFPDPDDPKTNLTESSTSTGREAPQKLSDTGPRAPQFIRIRARFPNATSRESYVSSVEPANPPVPVHVGMSLGAAIGVLRRAGWNHVRSWTKVGSRYGQVAAEK